MGQGAGFLRDLRRRVFRQEYSGPRSTRGSHRKLVYESLEQRQLLFAWPAYSPNIEYDFNEDFGPLEPPTKIIPAVSGVAGVYADDWWSFVWGEDKNPIVTDAAWIPMIERFNEDFTFITDVMGWPRDKLAQNGFYSTVYLFGSGLSTDNASNTTPGGWMGTVGWNGEPWHNVLASYIPVSSFDPAHRDDFQTGAMIHEGIHAIFANMPGGYNSAWAHESFNVWLQGTMESLRSGSFSGMGGLSVGSQIAPFIPIESYSGWLQDGTFGGPAAQGVNKYNENGQVSTWREILGGYQYGEAFPHALEVILGPKSIPWIWNADHSGYLLQDMALAEGGLGDEQARRVIQEYRGRQAFQDFEQWSHAFRQLLHNYWGTQVQEEGANFDVDVEPWTMTNYVATTNNGGTLTPEARTLPGWSGANQIPLTVDPSAASVSVDFAPLGDNMSLQLVYRDTDGVIHYSEPVASGTASMPVSNVVNNVVVAVVCNTDYVYEGEQTRTAKFDYRLDIGAGVTGTADIYTKWWDWNPDTYTITTSAGPNGSIGPFGEVVVDNGSLQTFTFSPDAGYAVDQVFLNGHPVGSPTSYTLNPVLGNSEIHVTFRDVVAPSAPSGLIATAANGSVNLDWADNGETDFDSYTLYRGTSSGGAYTPLASGLIASNYIDNSVIDGATYYYVVTASDVGANESDISSEATVTAIDSIAPAVPTGLDAQELGSTTILDWADNLEADFGSYSVYRSTTSGSGYVEIASGLQSSNYTDNSLVAGTTYYYVVTAVDESSNESAYSSEFVPVSTFLVHWDFDDPSLGAAQGASLPDSDGYNTWRVAALDKSGNGNHITTWDYPAAGFNWSNNSTDGDLSIKSSGDYPAAFTWSSRSTPAVDVEQFTGQSFTVEALATVSGGGWRTVLGRDAYNVATNDPASAALYLGLDDTNHARFRYVDVNGNSVDLRSTTTYAADDNAFHHFAGTTDGSTVSLYVDGVLVAQTENASMAGLAKGTTSGSGYHAGGWSIGRGLWDTHHVDRWYGYIDSVSIAAATLQPGAFVLSKDIAAGDPAPVAPTGLTATGNDGTVDLDWEDNSEQDFKYYTVYRSTKPGTGFAPIRLGLTTSSYTDPSADNGTTYYYVVTASDVALGESDFGSTASATPTDVTPPATPTALSASAGDGSVSLDWGDNADSDFASYTIYRSTTSGSGYSPIATGLTVSAFVDNGVANATTYYYVVTASDTSALESLNSAEATATPVATELASGTVIGSPGSWGGLGNTIDKAFDGDLGTFYDAVNSNGDWAGLDLGSPQSIVSIKYSPRASFASRMLGGMFQGSNTANFSRGVVTLFTISATPAEGTLTDQTISSPQTFRYVRYIGPDGGHTNVAEVEFYTAAVDVDPPAVPLGLSPIAGNGVVTLDWDDNAEPDFASYTVYRSTNSGFGYSPVAGNLTSSSYVDSTGVYGETYYYVVTATDTSSNESGMAIEVGLAPQLLGDYNLDSVVDAGDYTVWRDNLGLSVSAFSVADGSGDGQINSSDYNVWRTHFGETYTPPLFASSGAEEFQALAVSAATLDLEFTEGEAETALDAAFVTFESPTLLSAHPQHSRSSVQTTPDQIETDLELLLLGQLWLDQRSEEPTALFDKEYNREELLHIAFELNDESSDAMQDFAGR